MGKPPVFATSGNFRPLVKYDLNHGTTARDTGANIGNNQDSRGVQEWRGYCLGGAIASAWLNQPQPQDGLKAKYNNDELEGLWAILAETGKHTPDYNAGKFYPAGPPQKGNDGTDAGAPIYHHMLEYYVKMRQQTIISDMRIDQPFPTDPKKPRPNPNEVWNHAIWKYSAKFEQVPGKNERYVKITVDVFANQDHRPPTDDNDDRKATYIYQITYDENDGYPVAANADWIEVKYPAYAPKTFFTIKKPVWTGDDTNILYNKDVTLNNVRKDDKANQNSP